MKHLQVGPERPQAGGQPIVVLAVAVLASVWTLGTPDSAALPEGWQGLLGGILLGELAAVSLGDFGFLSLSIPFTLGLAGLGNLRLAVPMVWAAVFLRTLSRGAKTPAARWLEFLSDLFPALLGLLAISSIHRFNPTASPTAGTAVGSIAFTFAWLTVPGLLTANLPTTMAEHWTRVRDSLVGNAGALACVGVFLALGSQQIWFGLVVALAAVAGFFRNASMARDNEINRTVRSEQRDTARTQATKEQSLDLTRQAQERTKKELEVRLKIYDMVEDLLAAQPQEPHLEKVVYSLLGMLRVHLQCTSAALLIRQDQQWVPLGAFSPHRDRLYSADLLTLHEPSVEQAWRNATPTQLSSTEGDESRIFFDERTALAIPLQSKGVLYLGNQGETPYRPDQIEFALGLANHAWLAVDAARFFEAQQRALESEAAVRAEMQSLVQRLAMVLDGVADLISLQDPEALADHAVALIPRLVPQQTFLLVQVQEHRRSSRPAPPELAEIITTVLTHGRPLLLDDVLEGRFATLGEAALVAVPVLVRQKVGGVLLVGGPSFQREDMNILSVLAYQMGAAYHGARLFADLEATHEALKESQAQLIQSSKMAAIGQLAGGVAHELNTPLGAIALAIDGAISNMREKPDRAEKRLERAVGSVQQMKEIVAKLLFYSRDARTVRRETDINAVLEDLLQLIGNQFRLDNVQIETDFQPLPPLWANQNELQQIFTNLMINARDAVLMEGASARRIRLATRTQGESLLVLVQDWGCGIPQEIRERIFEPFFTTKEVGKGTGLGLSVTLQLLEQHAGTLEVESEPGQGTRFTLRFALDAPRDDE